MAGGWFIATGVGTLLQFNDLQLQAGRLFGGDPGATDAIAAAEAIAGLTWRHLISAAGGPHAREAANSLIEK